MNKSSVLIIILVLITSLVSCVKQIELTEENKGYIFMPEDIQGFNVSDYTIKPLKNGKTYFFTSNRSKLNGVNMLYGIELLDKNNAEIEFNSIINLQSNEERAKELFDGIVKTQKSLLPSYVVEVDPDDFGVDNVHLLISEDSFYIALRKDNLVYEVQIDGLKIGLEHVEERLMKKFNYILEHGL